MKNILIIDDEISICQILTKFLKKSGYSAEFATSGKQGLKALKEKKFDLILCDYNLGDIYGSDILEKIQQTAPEIVVIFISGYGNLSTAVNLMKQGAYHYLTKPLYPDLILETIEKAFAENVIRKQEKSSGTAAQKESDYVKGESKASKVLFNHVDLVAPTDFSVIIQGETGTGKEAIARFIHNQSNRRDQPFLGVDCGSLGKDIAASELFGYEKGAFTGALQEKEGVFSHANGGTVFLDEIGNLSYEIQIYLLRAIQEKVIRKVGSSHEKEVDVRIIVATNEDLLEKVQKKEFREDLYHRLNEFKILVPPLRERKDDMDALVEVFLRQASEKVRKKIRGLSDSVWELFYAYHWPGNIRELKNVIKRACLLTPDGNYIGPESLPLELSESSLESPAPAGSFLKDITFEMERKEILKVLEEVGHNKTKAAAILNIDRKTLYNKLRKIEEFDEGNL